MTDHRVDDEQDLVWVNGLANVAGLFHEFFVDTQAAGGVNDYNAVLLLGGVLDGVFGYGYRVANTVAGFWGKHVYTGALTDYLKLVDGVWSLKIGSHQYWSLALVF